MVLPNLLLSNRMATSRTRARTFRGTNDLFTLILDYKVTLEVLGPVPSSADSGPIEFSSERTIANFNPVSAATRTSPKNTPADRLAEILPLKLIPG